MPLTANGTLIRGTIACSYTETVTDGFAPANHKPSLTFGVAPNVATFNYPFAGEWELAASASVTIDVRSIVTTLNRSVTVDTVLGFILTGTALVSGGQLQLQPDVTNPLTWFFIDDDSNGIRFGVAPNVPAGCGVAIYDGTPVTVTALARNWLLSNPGTQTVTAKLLAIVGGA